MPKSRGKEINMYEYKHKFIEILHMFTYVFIVVVYFSGQPWAIELSIHMHIHISECEYM